MLLSSNAVYCKYAYLYADFLNEESKFVGWCLFSAASTTENIPRWNASCAKGGGSCHCVGKVSLFVSLGMS